ncbi:MAG: hypothetical protein RLZ98_798 [Pseudomonadota bacterium]|jgi:putative MATE family efflux protein
MTVGGAVTEAGRKPPKFVTGSILRHILVMTGTGAAGLVAIFIGDLANIFFLSRLNDVAIVAAVGYAGALLYFTIAISIGLSIAAAAAVSVALGGGREVDARRLSTSAHVITAVVSLVVVVMFCLALPLLLRLIGAEGRTADLAYEYLLIIAPGIPLLGLAMVSSAVLRAAGDANRAMYVTLAGAASNIILDPIFIFGLGLGIHGAAIATLIGRLVMMLVGFYGVARVHGLLERPEPLHCAADARVISTIAVPAILTNVATPFANAYVTAAVAPFGDGAVAGWTIIGRIMPVAFGAIYALSGSVGPIIGQNLGAGDRARMREALTMSLAVTAAFTLAAWLLLALAAGPIVGVFRVEGEAADLIYLFCRWLAPLFLFLGALFVANAAFNTLGRAHYSTLFNWARATVGTIPFVMIGAHLAGAAGVLVGNMIGGIPFGIASVWLGYRLVDRITMPGKQSPQPTVER